jgi:uncharacterized RDD family membrane protein YckC
VILHQVITTEKVPFTYRVAGIGARFLAWLVDAGLLVVILFIGAYLAMVVEIGRAGLGGAVFLAAFFVTQVCYFLFFEWAWHGQTPGKHLMGIRVVTWNGTSMSFLQSAGRNILRFADGLPFPLPLLYTLGVGVAACNREHRRLGDLAAGTLVVHVERRPRPIQALQESRGEADRAWRQQARQRLAQLNRDQKQTLLDLVLRRDQLRVAERARMFRAAAQYFRHEAGLSPERYQSDEKFILALEAEIGTRGAASTELVASPR